MSNKVIFIQIPDDETEENVNGLIESMRRAELPYTFVVVPIGYKAMDADEVRTLLDSLLSKV